MQFQLRHVLKIHPGDLYLPDIGLFHCAGGTCDPDSRAGNDLHENLGIVGKGDASPCSLNNQGVVKRYSP